MFERIPRLNSGSKPKKEGKEEGIKMETMLNGFDEFWSVYPRRVAKEAARKAYGKALKMAPPAVILDGAKRYARQRAGEDMAYTKHPATWLNAGCWGDEVSRSVVPVSNAQVAGFYAADGSPELAAWDEHYMAMKRIHAPRDRRFGWLFPTRWPPGYYDGTKDFAGSLDVGYAAVRERVAAGGPGWEPKA